jgi:UDP-N-acetylmuramate--alanine ligase
MKIDFSKIKTVHFFGIGGIGLSAIARMFLLEGPSISLGVNKKVSGSDVSDSEIISGLKELGAKISIGQSIADVPEGTDLIIYSGAITVADPRLFEEIKKLKIPSISYAEALGLISKDKKTIAVSGTHGKTTTTAMIAKILIDAGLEPSVIIGSLIKDPLSGKAVNFIKGEGKYLVVEADEYQRSFLNLQSHILVITNIDSDHLDYYKDLADIQSAFAELAAKVPRSGVVVTNFSNANISSVIETARASVLDYHSADISGLNLKFPGEHNRENARAALTVSDFLGVPRTKAIKSLNEFEGAWRRFEYLGKTKNGVSVYDDYAHNPQKVRAVLSGAREMFPKKRIVAVFQPHLYSRTKSLFEEFSNSFNDADEVIFLPIFPAREKFDPSISSEMLSSEVAKKFPGKTVRHMAKFEEAAEYLKKISNKEAVIMTIGAGDVYKIGQAIIEGK